MNTDDPPISRTQAMLLLRATVAEGRSAPVEPGQLSARVMQYGSMELRWYAPQDSDKQVPHDRDEIYVIQSGSAVFVRAEEADPFGDDAAISVRGMIQVEVRPGDVLFTPAGAEHRFEAMSADFGAWMIFYGPEGGEQP